MSVGGGGGGGGATGTNLAIFSICFVLSWLQEFWFKSWVGEIDCTAMVIAFWFRSWTACPPPPPNPIGEHQIKLFSVN